MTMVSSSLHTRKVFFLTVLLIVFSVFTAEVVDLREELRIISCLNSYLDNDVTAGLVSSPASDTVPVITLRAIHQKSSVEISFLHLLPYAFRAPPLTVWS